MARKSRSRCDPARKGMESDDKSLTRLLQNCRAVRSRLARARVN